jgi:hypothetical protein
MAMKMEDCDIMSGFGSPNIDVNAKHITQK